MKYKVVMYKDAVKLEKGLNEMYNDGYTPEFVMRSSNGYITVVYSKS